MDENKGKIRVDLWLWTARFFKTRSLASKAVSGGKVHLNSKRIKPARLVQPGDRLLIHKGSLEFDVFIKDVIQSRRPAKEAQLLYEETEESRVKREEYKTVRRMANAGHRPPRCKPNKRDRRKIKEFLRKNEGE